MTSGESSRDQEGPESMHCDMCMQASYLNFIALIVVFFDVAMGC